MGHAVAIITGEAGTAESKYLALTKGGVRLAVTIGDVVRFLQEIILDLNQPINEE